MMGQIKLGGLYPHKPHEGEYFDISLFDGHEGTARRNHGNQTLGRLAERGGLNWSEALAILEDRPLSPVPEVDAESAVRSILEGSIDA
mgnify:CR=1 FL=1